MDLAREALTLAEASGDTQTQAQVCGAIAETYQQYGRFGPDIELIEKALDLASEAGDLARMGQYLHLAVHHAVGVGEYERTKELFDRARAIALATDDALLTCQLHRSEGLMLCFAGDPAAGLEVNLEGVALAHAHGLAELEIIMLHNTAEDYLDLGRKNKALYYFSESLRSAQAARFDRLTEANQMFVGYLEVTHLGSSEGFAKIEEGLESASRSGRLWNLNQGHRLLGEARLYEGDLESAAFHLEEALHLAQNTGVAHFVAEVRQALERLAAVGQRT